jgi:predicted GH43/DUF377 family glycosyl hydrolase
MVGRIGYVDVDADNPCRLLKVSANPVLDIGAPGCFDDNGVVPTCVLPVGDTLFLYYVGFQLGHRVRYFMFEGLAISQDGGESFARLTTVPIIDRSDGELHVRSSAFVMKEQGLFRMWYAGGTDWTSVDGKSLPVYNLRYLESEDGISWGKSGAVCVDFAHEDEHAFGRPFVLRHGGKYKMWYSVRTRSRGYRLGYAESQDGILWIRMDNKVGIDVSQSGWDSEMIAYSSIVVHRDRTYMFYNGNNCGETGFGHALLEAW